MFMLSIMTIAITKIGFMIV